MGNPEVPRDDEARAFPPSPPPAPRVAPAEPVIDGDLPGASVSPVEEADAAETPDAMPEDLAVSADLAMARVDDLDIPPADVAVPDFSIPEPPEIPPLDTTAVVLLEDDSAGVSSEVPPPVTRSELRARTTAGESTAAQAPVVSGNTVPEPPPAASAPAAPFGQGADAPASGSSNPSGGDTYRGWPIVIFLGLAALLIAAVIGILVLVNNPPTIAASDDSGTEVAEPVAVDEVSEPACSDLCAEIAAATKSNITGPNDGVVWTMAEEWQDAAAPVLSASGATSAGFTSAAGELQLSVMAFADDDAVVAAAEELGAQRTEPLTSESSVYDDGTGTSSVYADGTRQAIIWHVPSADAAPRLMLIEGPDDDAVFDFYLALPF